MKVLNWKLFLEELVGEKPISNLQSYIEGMNYSMRDKLFFTEIVNFDVIVDFGCADGTFLEELSKINPNYSTTTCFTAIPCELVTRSI